MTKLGAIFGNPSSNCTQPRFSTFLGKVHFTMRDQPAGEKNDRYSNQNDEPQAQKNAEFFAVRTDFGSASCTVFDVISH